MSKDSLGYIVRLSQKTKERNKPYYLQEILHIVKEGLKSVKQLKSKFLSLKSTGKVKHIFQNSARNAFSFRIPTSSQITQRFTTSFESSS